MVQVERHGFLDMLWLLKLGTQKMLGGTDMLWELCVALTTTTSDNVHVFISFIIRTATHLLCHMCDAEGASFI